MPTAAELLCDLCAEPCAPAPGAAADGLSFCCAGCRNVYAILKESGVATPAQNLRDTELFRKSLELGLVSVATRRKSQSPAIPQGVVEERTFHVRGMWCSSCAWLIEHVLQKEPGVESATVFFTSDILRLRYYPQVLPLERLATRLGSLGYALEASSGEARDRSPERRADLLRVGISAFLWLNVMMLNLAVYFGIFEELSASMRRLLPFVVMVLSAPVVFYCAIPILRAAFAGLRVGVVRMETLLALGITAAWGYSAVQAFRGGGHIYFDISCAIVTLVLLGKYVERNAKDGATRSVAMLYQMLPAKARVLKDGKERFVAIDSLHPGDTFLVKAGERIPADGVVLDGDAFADESILTGESHPVPKQVGDAVAGGSLNSGGILQVRVSAAGADTVLARIVAAVEAALMRRSEVERVADRISRIFVPAVIALAAGIGVAAALTGLPPAEAMLRAITVLVIACPCALGIATPLAVTAAVGSASRRGIVISDTRALERISRIDTVLLDKTGTVTEGRFSLLNGETSDLGIVAALEACSEHPLGLAVVDAARRHGIPVPQATHVEICKGRGVRGLVGDQQAFCGNRTLLREAGLAMPASIECTAREWEEQGFTVAFYGWAEQVRGALQFGDTIRADAMELIASLRGKGLDVRLVSGDSRATTASVAKSLGLDKFYAEILPDQKQNLVRELQDQGLCVAMAGDGVNDAPALAQANLGIAMGSGTALAMKAAGVVLMGNQLGRVTEVFTLARRTLRVVRQNLFWAFFYNVAGITLAASGKLNPIIAAGAMVMSSLFVIANSSRLLRRSPLS